MTKPNKNEYVGFYQPYIDVLTDEELSLSAYLEKSLQEFEALMPLFVQVKEDYRYEKGKWTVKELVQHLIDTERVFVYRALRFSRKDTAVLNGFDENSYAENCQVENRSLASLVEEFSLLRKSSLLMFSNLDMEQLERVGFVDDNLFSVKALGFICSGHLLHHLSVLRERYSG